MSLIAYPRIADWLTAEDGRVIVHTGKVDIGQRITTALMQIVHEELGVPLRDISVAPVRTGHAPNEGITSGSNSIEQSGHALRMAAATMRARLIALAIDQFGGAAQNWTLTDGHLTHPETNQPLRVVDLMEQVEPDAQVDPLAVVLPVPKVPAHVPMRGLEEMVTGRFVYIHDLDVPGMLHARVVRPPQAHARLKDISATVLDDLHEEGLRIVRDGSFLAVAGALEWPVVKAALRLFQACTWQTTKHLSEADVFTELRTQDAQRLHVVDGTPRRTEIPDPLTDPDYQAGFERPYLMHGSLAPSAALAVWSDDMLKITTHSQGIYPLLDSIADSLGLQKLQVEITHHHGAGCYGHNGADDAAFEAALIAMQLPDTPVLLKWTREDEHAWEPYAPAMAVDLAVKLSKNRQIAALSADVFSDTHRGRPRAGPNRAGPAKLLANHLRATPIPAPAAEPNMNTHGGMHRNLDPIYAVANKRLVKNLTGGLVHRTSALRCLGATTNVFAHESMMDELALVAKEDAIAYRQRQLEDPRAVAVLDKLAERCAQRPKPAGDSIGRGIAFAQYKNTMTRVAICVDLAVTELGETQLIDAMIVADAGRVIDVDGLQAQLEGGFLQGASWALYEEVTWDRDGITSRDWDNYPVIRFDNIPTFDLTILHQTDAPSVGAGEASPGPTIAAIANAIHDATGLRLRRMPFTADAILRLALAE